MNPFPEHLKKYSSRSERGFLGFGEALAKEQVQRNPVTEPKRSQNPKRPPSRFSQPNGCSISENAPTTPTRWMLVDDNENILLMLSAILESLTTATVECYTSPQDALAAFREAPEAYELVITDFEMPNLNGMQLCHQMRAVAPAQKIILATGSGFFTETSARLAGFSALLDKPFPLPLLKAALQNTLGLEKFSAELVAA